MIDVSVADRNTSMPFVVIHVGTEAELMMSERPTTRTIVSAASQRSLMHVYATIVGVPSQPMEIDDEGYQASRL
jgi:hypothetical protein